MNTVTKKTILKFQSVVLILSVVFLFSGNTLAQASKASTSGVFDFETQEIDYGTIEKDSNGERTFTLVNTGQSPIVISDIKTSCGCTVPTKPKGPVMPGETATIGVKYKTSKVGAFSKTITVLSNASEPSKILKISGVVVESANKLGA